eukprot:m.275749 g.275749  ORF g.275749 m.275749 type:complete len:368 (+) comp19357_c0_seq1:89-1192(+)
MSHSRVQCWLFLRRLFDQSAPLLHFSLEHHWLLNNMWSQVALAAAVVAVVAGHGQMTLPTGRNNGTLANAGNCFGYECFWFSQIVEIPGEPTLNEKKFRTVNVDVSSGADDFTRQMPWRAPGTAPVFGSGCGVAGGGDKERGNGGIPPPGIKQGADALDVLKPSAEVTWRRGSIQEVAWAIYANHGGGYAYRLCKNDGKNKVTEECFQRTPLTFVGDKSVLRWAPVVQYGIERPLPDIEIPAVRVSVNNQSTWSRNPVPACKLCDQGECMKHKSWDEQQHCAQSCSGLNMTRCPPGTTQFPEPASGVNGYFLWHDYYASSLSGFPWNIVDKVQIPEHIEPGKYLLSWRWDCEQSRQIWQNCADIVIE